MRNGELKRRQGGFTYIFLLFVVALGGVLLATAGQLWWMNSKRDKEEELLYAGRQIRQAIESYYRASPQAQGNVQSPALPGSKGEYPRDLADLLEDRRFSPPLRHLRRLYVDPIAGSKDWGVIKVGDRIVGIHSLSTEKPLKQSKFPPGCESFSGAERYSEWGFRADANAADVTLARDIDRNGNSASAPLLSEATAPSPQIREVPSDPMEPATPPPPPFDPSRSVQCNLAFGKARLACLGGPPENNAACIAAAQANREVCRGG